MDASQVVTCKALSLACWRITGEASSIGVPLRFFRKRRKLKVSGFAQAHSGVQNEVTKRTMEIDNIYNCDCLEGMSELPTGHKYCIVTDPPFNVGYHYNEYKDNKSEDEYFEWLEQITKGYPVVMIHYPEALYKFAFQIGQFPERVASWVYNSNTPRQHRDIAYFGIKPDFTLMHQPYKNPTDKRIAKRIAEGHEGGMLYDWWEINQVKNVSKEKHGVTHPCQMPVEVMQRVVGIIDPEYTIIDPFMGSGTTAIACIKERRHFIGFELSKEYFDKAVKRIKAEQAQLTLF